MNIYVLLDTQYIAISKYRKKVCSKGKYLYTKPHGVTFQKTKSCYSLPQETQIAKHKIPNRTQQIVQCTNVKYQRSNTHSMCPS